MGVLGGLCDLRNPHDAFEPPEASLFAIEIYRNAR